MSEEKNSQSPLLMNLAVLATPEGFQKYLLGTKKDGQPRAVYDIVKDYTLPKKKKKDKDKGKKHKKSASTYAFYLDSKKHKRKKHKKDKKKYWHI